MHLSLYDYQAKASRYRKEGLNVLKKQGNHTSKLNITFTKNEKYTSIKKKWKPSNPKKKERTRETKNQLENKV